MFDYFTSTFKVVSKISIDVGDIVLIVEEDKTRVSWPLGAISFKIFRSTISCNQNWW